MDLNPRRRRVGSPSLSGASVHALWYTGTTTVSHDLLWLNPIRQSGSWASLWFLSSSWQWHCSQFRNPTTVSPLRHLTKSETPNLCSSWQTAVFCKMNLTQPLPSRHDKEDMVRVPEASPHTLFMSLSGTLLGIQLLLCQCSSGLNLLYKPLEERQFCVDYRKAIFMSS